MPLIGTAQYYSGFNPLALNGCDMWLDAMDSTSITMSGNNVVRWNDKSGNTRHAVATGNPQLGTTTTGRQAIVLSGTNYFDVSGASTLSGSSSTVFIQASATTNTRNLYNLWGNARSLTFQLYYNGTDNLFFTANTLFFNSNAMCCIVDDLTTAVCSSFFNGTANNTTTARTVTPNTGFVLGANNGGTNGWIGNIQEMIIYNRALPAGERQQVEGYLGAKWGIRSTIPTTHPFKSLTPFSRPFVPVDISSCALWLDAMDPCGSGVRPASGTSITTWIDKSGGAQNAATGGTAPIYSNSMVNFNGNSSLINTTFTYALRNRSVFIVGSQTTSSSASAFEGIFVLGATGGNFDYADVNSCVYLGRGSNGNQNDAFGVYLNGDYIVSYLTNTSPAPFAVYSDVFGTNSGTLHANGNIAQTDTTAGTIGSGTGYLVGGRYYGGPSAFLNGGVSELIMYNTALSTAQRQLVETYLTNKWGTRGLTPVGHRARLFSPLSPSFTPRSVTGCALWLDAADLTTITMSGSNVAQWRDKSSNAYIMNTAPPGCALPIVGSNLNGLPTVGINTTSTGIKQATVIDGFKNAFWVRKERGGNQGYQFYFGADGTYDFHTGDSAQFAHGGFSPQGVRDASLSMFTSNGVTRGTLSTTAMPAGGLINLVSISNATGSTKLQGLSYDRGNTTRSATCDWGEVILYTTALTALDIRCVEGYLAWKWGVTSYLPSTHPFKTVTP